MMHRLRVPRSIRSLACAVLILWSLSVHGCSGEKGSLGDVSGALPNARSAQIFETEHATIATRGTPNPERVAYFGDLHVHTTYSFDAYAFGTTATPSDAYRYARGEAIQHPAGFQMQLREPLDFYAVTDHAFFLGVVGEAADRGTALSKMNGRVLKSRPIELRPCS